MRVTLDTATRSLVVEQAGEEVTHDLYSDAAFHLLSRLWLKVGWNQKHTYTYTWLGRPIIQLPQDLARIQEVIYKIKPDVLVETGIAHGGSLVFYASLFRAMGKGRVVGVDVQLRPQNREALLAHELASYIFLVDGSSTDPEVVHTVSGLIRPGEKAMVVLDSDHSREHVHAELEAYAGLVTRGSYLVATDGIMQDLHDVPRGQPDWEWDNPAQAARDFARRHPEFVLERPEWPFNESTLEEDVTHWPGAWLRKV